jgi:regulatory protein spx
MIKIYTVASCSSCKKAKEWLIDNHLPFEEINLITDKIPNMDLVKILSLTENGTEDIISRRSKAYERLNIDFDTLPISKLIEVIQKNRTLLRRPLIVDDKRLQVGYNEDDIRKFLPRDVRTVELEEAYRHIQ